MIIEVHVKPGAKETKVVKKEGNVYTIAIKAQTQDGKANQELIKFLRKQYKEVKIKTGHTSRRKLILVNL